MQRQSSALIESLKTQYSELRHAFRTTRKTRSAVLAPIGHFFKWAFGNMDDQDEASLYTQLELLRNSTGGVINLQERQVTLLRSSYEETAEEILGVERNLKHTKSELEELKQVIEQKNEELQDLRADQNIHVVATQLITLLTALGYYINRETRLLEQLYHLQLPPILVAEQKWESVFKIRKNAKGR